MTDQELFALLRGNGRRHGMIEAAGIALQVGQRALALKIMQTAMEPQPPWEETEKKIDELLRNFGEPK